MEQISEDEKMLELEQEIKRYRKAANEEKKKMDAIERRAKREQKAIRLELNRERKKMWQLILDHGANQGDISINALAGNLILN